MGIKRFKSRENIEHVKTLECVCANKECIYPVTPDHIKTKGSGGDDSLKNLMPLCVFHHRLKEDAGIVFMVETYKEYKKDLIERGLFKVYEYRKAKEDMRNSLT